MQLMAQNGVERYCTFYLDGGYYGIDVACVQEVLRHHVMTRIPLAPDHISGLINLRGQIVTAIDLRTGLGLERRPSGLDAMNGVIRHEGDVASLLVDEIDDVITVGRESYESPPTSLTGKTRELIRAVHKLEANLLLVFDVEKVFECARIERQRGNERATNEVHTTQ